MSIDENDFTIMIKWHLKIMPWNEICAQVVEVFGLPGGRYDTAPAPDYLIFKFKNENDYYLCRILLSEYI